MRRLPVRREALLLVRHGEASLHGDGAPASIRYIRYILHIRYTRHLYGIQGDGVPTGRRLLHPPPKVRFPRAAGRRTGGVTL